MVWVPPPITAETPVAETGGTYVSLGSYSIISVPGNPNLAPTAWRLEGVEPYTETRQTLDEAIRPWMDGCMDGLRFWKCRSESNVFLIVVYWNRMGFVFLDAVLIVFHDLRSRFFFRHSCSGCLDEFFLEDGRYRHSWTLSSQKMNR